MTASFSLELHDSTLESVETLAGRAVIRLTPAYLHRVESEGERRTSTGWLQDFEIWLEEPIVTSMPKVLDCWLADGTLEIDGKLYNNVIPLPQFSAGDVLLKAVTEHSEALQVQAKLVRFIAIGEPRFLENHPDDFA